MRAPLHPAHGVHGQGTRAYTPAQRSAVVAALRSHVGPDRAVKVAALAAEAGVPGRTVRQLLSDVDGQEMLLAGGNEGVWVASLPDEAEEFTRRMESQIGAMAERVRRRRRLARRFDKTQRRMPL